MTPFITRYSLTAPPVKPATIYFWRAKKNITAGTKVRETYAKFFLTLSSAFGDTFLASAGSQIPQEFSANIKTI